MVTTDKRRLDAVLLAGDPISIPGLDAVLLAGDPISIPGLDDVLLAGGGGVDGEEGELARGDEAAQDVGHQHEQVLEWI